MSSLWFKKLLLSIVSWKHFFGADLSWAKKPLARPGLEIDWEEKRERGKDRLPS